MQLLYCTSVLYKRGGGGHDTLPPSKYASAYSHLVAGPFIDKRLLQIKQN